VRANCTTKRSFPITVVNQHCSGISIYFYHFYELVVLRALSKSESVVGHHIIIFICIGLKFTVELLIQAYAFLSNDRYKLVHFVVIVNIFLGALSRIWAVTLVSPLELVRTKMQSQKMAFYEVPYTISDSNLMNLLRTNFYLPVFFHRSDPALLI
jgi:hypothetical protein